MDYDKGNGAKKLGADAAGGAEGGMAEGTAGGPGQGNALKDASDEAVEEIEKRRDGGDNAGAGDIG
jgi:hypothetical protein